MHCIGCGNKLLDNTAFCTSCGRQADNHAGGFAQPQPQQAQAQTYPDQKSRLVAGLLALLIGAYGVHNFYLGFTKKAVWQLLLSTLFGILTFGITSIIVAIWAIVEGITFFTSTNMKDAKGIPLKDSF